jgi:hypothetical protein
MHLYRQLWKKLAQTAKKLEQQLVGIVYNAVTQAFTPPHHQKSKQRISH